jgi:hypothetical protein
MDKMWLNLTAFGAAVCVTNVWGLYRGAACLASAKTWVAQALALKHTLFLKMIALYCSITTLKFAVFFHATALIGCTCPVAVQDNKVFYRFFYRHDPLSR